MVKMNVPSLKNKMNVVSKMIFLYIVNRQNICSVGPTIIGDNFIKKYIWYRPVFLNVLAF